MPCVNIYLIWSCFHPSIHPPIQFPPPPPSFHEVKLDIPLKFKIKISTYTYITYLYHRKNSFLSYPTLPILHVP